MPKTWYLEGNIINAALRGIPYTPPTNSYVALYTSSPTPAGGGVEVSSSGTGYGRQIVTWNAPVNGQTQSAADVIFLPATSLWGTVTSFGLVDSNIGGNVLYYANLNAPILVNLMDQLRFPAGMFVLLES